ncbi:hypothetical protein LO772_12335 [Yinghuangia sp. ASG 101]|uniref:hypothetical protein n=1 Tax=Yinghuangia sp. ASG 101 TaxID=2896848 RepID=UPI001E44B5FB|nr:hypothetical protein [Yinghuangia sp. ASG 101]UGQ14303.1 hypothetical protein LO772_12335 [Yinghuangia sp. ASG 101]
MPDGQFGVDLAWLDGLAADLRQGTEIVNEALNALEETGPTRTGHKDLDKACDKFHDNWSHGPGFMREDIERVAEAIRATRTNYARPNRP